MIKYNIRLFANCRRDRNEPWQEVICYISFDNHPHLYRQTVEDYFKYHLGLDIEYTKKNHNHLFSEPHNIATALAVYSYFRVNSLFFEYVTFDYINIQLLPTRPADVENPSYKIWIEQVQQGTAPDVQKLAPR